MDSKGDYCRIHLRVRAITRAGQFVGVTGLAGESSHVRLVTTPEAYPIWYTASPIVVPRCELVHYKYCIIEGGNVKVVERISPPRMLIPEETDLVLEDDFLQPAPETARQDGEGEAFEGMGSAVNSVGNNLSTTPVAGSRKRLNTETESNKAVWSHIAQRNSRLFLICYHLPVVIKRTNRPHEPFEASWAESLIAKSAGSVSGSIKTIWIGTVNVSVSDLSPIEKDFIIVLLRNMDCIPVFLDDEIAAKAYYGYCKTIMWPVFHNVDQLDQIHAAWNLPADYESQRGFPSNASSGNRSRSGSLTPQELLGATSSVSSENKVLEWNKKEVDYYEALRQVSQTFAKTVLDFVRDGDVAWIHDYHLMLVPQLLRDGLQKPSSLTKDLKIIFFLHIPFPTSQIFRTLPEATELMQSMVCADLVGFHAFDHARHFLNAAKRMLGLRSYTKPGGMLTLGVQDREVIVTMSHVSIETERVDAVLQHPEASRMAVEIQDRYKDMKIVLGVDVCQRLSGLALKLLAFDKLAADYVSSPERGGLVLIQRCIRQGSRLEDEETTSADIRKMVAEINSKYASSKQIFVDYSEVNSLSLTERIALFLSADVFLITPIREGLNLLPLEYIYARKSMPRAGCVIVSEFSTCSSLLNGSLKINPFAPVSVADAIEKALSMSNKDCEYRKQRDMPFIISHPSSLWTKQILNELEQLQSKVGHGSVGAVKLSEPLNSNLLLSAYQQAGRDAGICQLGTRVFIFDYGGALLHKEKYDIYLKQTLSAISGRKPSPIVMEALKKLSEDPKNVVMVITGLARMKLGETFKGLGNVALATSNGLIYSWGNTLAGHGNNTNNTCNNTNTITNAVGKDSLLSDDGRQWECMDCNIDWNTVSEIASPIITKFTFRTNGTCKTPRFPGIGWSYFGADPDWGRKQAIQLKLELEAALANFDVKITSLVPGSIEVVPKTLKKGMIVNKLLHKVIAMRGGRLPGLVTVMGAEEADDGMTQAVLDAIRETPVQGELQRMKAFTIAVGKRDSTSQFYINDIKDVERLLNAVNSSSATAASPNSNAGGLGIDIR